MSKSRAQDQRRSKGKTRRTDVAQSTKKQAEDGVKRENRFVSGARV